MREFKTLVLAAVALAFVAGIGAGSWISDLRAATTPSHPSVERRLENWNKRYNLTPSQQRRIRSVLVRYDAGRDRIFSEISAEQWQRLNRNLADSQREIDEILQEQAPADSPTGG
jgi:hypothetical protein